MDLDKQANTSISIHALREEGDLLLRAREAHKGAFLSTPSARRATFPFTCWNSSRRHFYPRPPRGGRLGRAESVVSIVHFYPRPPRGGRQSKAGKDALKKLFLSTPSARRATIAYIVNECISIIISIHALREEGDETCSIKLTAISYFYPRPPRGGRRARSRGTPGTIAISIHALREEGDGVLLRACPDVVGISIHALREEGDLSENRRAHNRNDFYPRPPRGGRPGGLAAV